MARRAVSTNLVKLTRANLATFTLEPGQTERVVWDTEAQGLGLRIRQSGKAAWIIRPPRSGGKSVVFTLGPANVLSLADARTAAKEKMAKATLGDDPHKVRREARARAIETVGPAIGRYIALAKGRLAPSTVYGLKNHLGSHWQALHSMPITSVRRVDVATQLDIITQENGPQAANRARSVLSTFFVWAMGQGLIEANPVLGSNKPAKDTARSRVLSEAELVKVWRLAGEGDFGRIVRLLILTGQRRDEVAGMTWKELDLAGALWSLPAARSKNKRPHDVPLSAPALKILSEAPQQANRPLIFGRGEGPFSGFTNAKTRLDAQVGASEHWTLHDLRRTAATLMGDKLGILPHVVEAVLNHVSGHKAGVAGIYNRATYTNEKRAALDVWAAHVVKLLNT